MKTLKSLGILAIVTVVFATASCSKEERSSANPETKISTIILSIEQPTDESATKTQLGSELSGSYPINWTKGDAHTDAIAVGTTSDSDVVKYTLSSVDTQDATKGTFTGETVSGAVKAFYPYVDVVSAAENAYNVNIPAVQTYTGATSFGEDAMPMYAVASSTNDLSSMKPLMSVLKITLSGNYEVQRIIISNKSEKLSGSATVTYSGSSASLAFASSGANDYVELVCPAAVDCSEDATFHIVVPATTTKSKYTVRVVTSESYVITKTFTPEKVFTAATIKRLGNMLEGEPEEYVKYVEGSYCGDAVTVCDITWAPVNCGYDATNYPYGKLYQWGRLYGQGYNDSSYSDGDYPGKPGGNQSLENLSSSLTSYPDGAIYNGKFYYNYNGDITDWYDGIDPAQDALWGESKTNYDPCPAGWRVPTSDEKMALFNGTENTGIDTGAGWDDNRKGYWFNGTQEPEVGQGLFLPAAGYRRHGYDGSACDRGDRGYYWTSAYDDSWYLDFDSNGALWLTTNCRTVGYSVRCVKE